MLDKILGKDIAAYVKRQKLLIAFSVILTVISTLFALIPVALIQPFVDKSILATGLGISDKKTDSDKALEILHEDKSSLENIIENSNIAKPTREAFKTLIADKPQESASDLTSIKIPWVKFETGSIFSVRKTNLVLVENISFKVFLVILCSVAFVSTLVKSLTLYFGNLAAAAFSQKAIRAMRIDLFNKFVSLHQGFFDKNKVGILISRSTADLGVMQARIASITIGLVQHPLSALVFLGYLLYENYKLTLIVFIAAPLIIGCIRLFGNKAKKHSIRVQDAVAEITSTYQEVLLCLRVVQGFCIGKSQSKKFRDLADQLYKKTMRWNKWNLGLGPMMDATTFLVLPAILLLGILYFHHTLGELITMFMAFQRVYIPVKSLAQINNDLRSLQGSTERVFSILRTESDIREKSDAIILPRHRESIEFKNVNFSYDPSIPILKDVSFKIKAGEMVAFVGSTGAGKSTLLDLVPRFYDVTGGSILIDGIDIRDVTVESLRRQIGIVGQEVLLFNDTIGNNISFSSPDVDMETLTKAARAAHAHDFIMAQPEQYNTIVGDRGTLLSGGQKQRIAIARAILADSSILLLDEIASALDAQSERIIQDAVDTLRSDHTIFVVAHRLSTVRTADRIFVLEKGMIIETGSFNELLKMNGRFRQLHDLQFQG
jgi:ATP-binding cassette, subfamily B, bacterial MsbA